MTRNLVQVNHSRFADTVEVVTMVAMLVVGIGIAVHVVKEEFDDGPAVVALLKPNGLPRGMDGTPDRPGALLLVGECREQASEMNQWMDAWLGLTCLELGRMREKEWMKKKRG